MTTLEMFQPIEWAPRPLDADVRLERTVGVEPEYARFLDGLVGGPWGYVRLQPLVRDAGTHVELQYFGLAERAIGRGLGGRLLEHDIAAAWSLPERSGLPGVERVWVSTGTLDGPAALPNDGPRGFEVCRVVVEEKAVALEPLGSWASTGGPAVVAGVTCRPDRSHAMKSRIRSSDANR